MNRRTDNEDFLSDVLSEGTPADFHDAVLHETLRRVGRQRRWRQARGAAAVLAGLGLIGFLALPHLRHTTAPPALLAERSYQLIQTQPLHPGIMVTTRPLASQQIVASIQTANVIHTTMSSDSFRIINDEELLALAAPRPAILVKLGQNSEQLVFVDSNDAEAIPLN